MEIIRQGEITSAGDICKLGIADFNRLNGYWQNDVTSAIRVLDTWVAGHAHYTIIKDDMTRYPDYSKGWDWHHIGHHERLGKLYWNMFHARQSGKIQFADSPDFSGTLELDEYKVRFCGDIGKVSASTLIFSLMHLNTHDLWISVVNENTQIVIELLADVERVFGEISCETLFDRAGKYQ